MKIEHGHTGDFVKMTTSRYLLLKSRLLLEPFLVKLGDMESHLLRAQLCNKPIDRPIYVTGLARAGTTITLEFLSQHADVASHRYRDIAQPFLPYLWNWLADHLPLLHPKPQARVHQDGILVTRDSPEAVEEIIWNRFFKTLHDEANSAVLNAATDNPAFALYYKANIGKFLLARSRSRYLSKANYNLTRLAYLVRIVPSARFIVMARNPVAHFISWIKQHEMFQKIQTADPRWLEAISLSGHHEFGLDQRFVNFGDNERVREIRNAWDTGQRAHAFGMYWASMYGHALDLAARDPLVRNAILFVRYEDLCTAPRETIDRMLAHAELDASSFENIREQYVGKLTEPQYYKATLDDSELHVLEETTCEIAARLGY